MYIITPIAHFAIASFLGLVGLNSSQRYRPAIFLFITIFCLLSFRDIDNVGLSASAADTCSKFIVLYLTHMGSALCVENYVLESKTQNPSSWDWIGAYKVLYNGRYVGTQRQVTDVPYRSNFFSNYFKLQDDHRSDIGVAKPLLRKFPALAALNRPRIVFIRNRILTILAIWTIDYYHAKLVATTSTYYDPLSMTDFIPSKEVYFRKFFFHAFNPTENPLPSTRDFFLRVWMVVYFLWSAWSLYTSVHDALAIFFVTLHLDSPEEWRPIYGSLDQAWSVRHFWGKFWHKAIYRAYTSYASWVSTNVLRLKKRSLIGKIFITFFVFALSGVIHAICEWRIGFTCAYWEEVQFFLLNACAIVLEMPVQNLWKVFVARHRLENVRVFERIVGYLWVFTFLFWVLPKSQMPKMWCSP